MAWKHYHWRRLRRGSNICSHRNFTPIHFKSHHSQQFKDKTWKPLQSWSTALVEVPVRCVFLRMCTRQRRIPRPSASRVSRAPFLIKLSPSAKTVKTLPSGDSAVTQIHMREALLHDIGRGGGHCFRGTHWWTVFQLILIKLILIAFLLALVNL